MRMWREKNRIFICIFFIFGVILGLCVMKAYKQWKDDHTGVPDLVSSSSFNNDYYLTVVANSSSIEDKEAFAREVVHMCQQNAFHSIRLSTDLGGYPSSLDITVYLSRKDIDKREEPVCKIEFLAEDCEGNYEITHDAEMFRLYLDGEAIEFF